MGRCVCESVLSSEVAEHCAKYDRPEPASLKANKLECASEAMGPTGKATIPTTDNVLLHAVLDPRV
jgi:hypothetical protein